MPVERPARRVSEKANIKLLSGIQIYFFILKGTFIHK